ncbi:MAG TPA: hypothetical protein VHD91_04255, partial [Gaiellaceae bacterium]|nr:hypothetical protein [Gaiellaceae bacterium]
GEPPPVEEIERVHAFREVVRSQLASPHRLRDLAISGDDVIALGMAPGPRVGQLLNELLDEVVDEPALNTREELLERARRKVRP